MAALISCPKHNMVACLVKTKWNTQFHEIVDFLTRSSIYYSLTVSPTVSTSIIEQFWNTATSKTVNDVSYIKAKVAGKTVSVSKASIRRDLLFNDVDEIDCLTNQEIYENLQLMRPDTTQDPKENLEGTSESQGDHVQIPYDSPLSGGHTFDKAEGGLNLDELLNQEARKECKPSISHHRAWLRNVSSTFDDLDVDLAHGMDYMETEAAVNKGRQSNETKELNLDAEDKDIDTARPEVHTVNAPVSTTGVTISTTDPEVSTVEPRTPPTTTIEEEPVKIKRKDQGIDQIERDEELTHKLHEEELAEIARIQKEKAAQEEASRVAIMEMFDENMGGYKHSQLKAKTFEEIQAMYERQKKRIDDFKPMDSDDAVKDSEKAAGKRVSDVSKKRKGGLRIKRMSKRKKTESKLEEEDLKTFLKIVPDKEGIIDYENCGVHTLTLEDGTEIHMLTERKYLLTKETLKRMMSLKLITESVSDGAYDLLRFIQKQIDEAGSRDGGKKALKFVSYHLNYKVIMFHHVNKHQELQVPEQTASSKRLLKSIYGLIVCQTYLVIKSPCFTVNKRWLVQSKWTYG
ncbi:hypothetical protein Tco_0486665 [Tanacetum coccineum]